MPVKSAWQFFARVLDMNHAAVARRDGFRGRVENQRAHRDGPACASPGKSPLRRRASSGRFRCPANRGDVNRGSRVTGRSPGRNRRDEFGRQPSQRESRAEAALARRPPSGPRRGSRERPAARRRQSRCLDASRAPNWLPAPCRKRWPSRRRPLRRGSESRAAGLAARLRAFVHRARDRAGSARRTRCACAGRRRNLGLRRSPLLTAQSHRQEAAGEARRSRPHETASHIQPVRLRAQSSSVSASKRAELQRGNPALQHLADDLRIGPFGLSHHLADQCPDRLLLAPFDVGDDLGVGRQHGVDDRSQLARRPDVIASDFSAMIASTASTRARLRLADSLEQCGEDNPPAVGRDLAGHDSAAAGRQNVGGDRKPLDRRVGAPSFRVGRLASTSWPPAWRRRTLRPRARNNRRTAAPARRSPTRRIARGDARSRSAAALRRETRRGSRGFCSPRLR